MILWYPKLPLVSLNDKKTLSMRKYIKQKETQIDDIKTLAKIILIATNYVFLVKKKSLLNKKSINHKETKNKTLTTTSIITSTIYIFLV
jgi:hypothetical protein